MNRFKPTRDNPFIGQRSPKINLMMWSVFMALAIIKMSGFFEMSWLQVFLPLIVWQSVVFHFLTLAISVEAVKIRISDEMIDEL